MDEIERRTYNYYRAARYGTGYRRRTARCAITEPWNAAYEAMKAMVKDTLRYDYGPTDWYCPTCHGAASFHPEYHTPDNCSVATAQAVIAKMEETE